MMRAVEVSAFDGPAGASVVHRPPPEPSYGEVLLRVEAAGVNFSDVAQARGLYQNGPNPPYIAGIEACGEVIAAGPGTHVSVGARLLGCGQSTFAEQVCLPLKSTIPLPEQWTPTMGASFFVQWMTAHASLKAVGRLAEGETVLIHAGAGGVGSAAIQLAKYYGATVITTVSSPEKAARALDGGADFVIDYRREAVLDRVKAITRGRGVDLVLEMVGGETFRDNLQVVVPFGRVVVYGAVTGQTASVSNLELVFAPVELLGFHLTTLFRRRPDLFSQTLSEMKRLTQQGIVRPEEPTVMPLERGAEALSILERGRAPGKLVLATT